MERLPDTLTKKEVIVPQVATESSKADHRSEYAALNEFYKNQTRPLSTLAPQAAAAACTYYQINGPQSFDGRHRFFHGPETMKTALSRMTSKLRRQSRQPKNYVYPPGVPVWTPQPHFDTHPTRQQAVDAARQHAQDTALYNGVTAAQLTAQTSHNLIFGAAMPIIVNPPSQPAATPVPVLVQPAPAHITFV